MNPDTRYRVIFVIDDPSLFFRVFKRDPSQRKGILFPGPLTLKEAQTCLSKTTSFPWRRDVIQEIRSCPGCEAPQPFDQTDLDKLCDDCSEEARGVKAG